MTYEDMFYGEEEVCPDCDGTGYENGFTPADWMRKHGLKNGLSMDDYADFPPCNTCGGHGLIDEDSEYVH